MSFLKKLGAYSFGNVITILAGFISFPIFTRMLTPSDYGLLSLINLTSALCVTFCKGGLQQAMIREWSADSSRNRTTLNTALFGSLYLSLSIFMVSAAILFLCGSAARSYLVIFLLTWGLILTESTRSILFNELVARQQSSRYNMLSIVLKYSQVGMAALFLFTAGANVVSLLSGFVLASVAVILCRLRGTGEQVAPSRFEPATFKAMLAFGIPLVANELTCQLLTFSDRYLIGYFKGAAAVGAYSAAYNLANYLQNLLVSAVTLSIYPIVVQKLNDEGPDSCRLFITESLGWFCLFGSAASFGFAALGGDLLVLTASERYADAAAVIAPVTFGGFLFALYGIAVGDLFVRKETKSMALMMGMAATLNICLNVFLIPAFGLLGAAYATLLPELLLVVVGLWKVGALVPRQLAVLGSRALPSLVMYALLTWLGGEKSWPSLVGRALLGATIWLFCVLILNRQARAKAFEVFGKLRLSTSS